jgi:putative Mg2+ transporter-C (MgtC) family protein
MSYGAFIVNVGMSFVLGVVIGLERQYHQHPAGLRTNALVCVGAALFVSLSQLMGDAASPTRVASYVVSGVGFLGGGVILKEGINVRGMNTAATLWCSAAVGCLAGAGFAGYAVIGTFAVLAVHVGLRPVAVWIDARRKTAGDVETTYRIRVVCEEKQEGLIRTILLRHVNAHGTMAVQGISTEEVGPAGQAVVVAEVFSTGRSDREVQEVMSRLNIEPSVRSVS